MIQMKMKMNLMDRSQMYQFQIINNNKMGSQFCSQPKIQASLINQNPLMFVFGEDNLQNKIAHQDTLSSKNKDIQLYLNECETKLKQSQRLFKDPTMKSDPVILKSLSSQDLQVKCTYERPYIFLNDPSTGRGKKYKIADTIDSKPSQILINDQVLQYFGVFLCFLSENPHLINQIIVTQSNTYGLAALEMYVGVHHQTVFVDDYILCNQKKPLFSQPIKGIYMWPCLLEKGWFKVKGNISKKIQKNTPQEVFQTFLPFPLQKILLNLQNNQQNKKILKKYVDQYHPGRSYMFTSKRQPSHKIGLSGRKHFYLLKYFDYQGIIYYYLRNPCGQFDFRGSHRLMTVQLRNKVQKETQQKVSEGNFLLDEDELIQQMEQVAVISYTKNSSIVSQEQIEMDINEEILIGMELKSVSLVSIGFLQSSVKWGEQSFAPVTYQIIHTQTNNAVSGYHNDFGCFGEKYISLLDQPLTKLQSGNYVIRIKKRLKQPYKSQSTKNKLIITAPQKIKIDYKAIQIFDGQFKNFLISEGKRMINYEQLKNTRSDIEHRSYWFGDLAIVYVEKVNKKKESVKVQVNFPELTNLQCLSHKINNDFTALPAFGDNLLIIFQKIDLTSSTVLGKYMIEAY